MCQGDSSRLGIEAFCHAIDGFVAALHFQTQPGDLDGLGGALQFEIPVAVGDEAETGALLGQRALGHVPIGSPTFFAAGRRHIPSK